MHHQITPGAVVQTADQIELRVRALEGNVAELEAFDGSFVGFRHVSSLTVCLPPAAKTAPAQSLAAAAGTGQGAGTFAEWLAAFAFAVLVISDYLYVAALLVYLYAAALVVKAIWSRA